MLLQSVRLPGPAVHLAGDLLLAVGVLEFSGLLLASGVHFAMGVWVAAGARLATSLLLPTGAQLTAGGTLLASPLLPSGLLLYPGTLLPATLFDHCLGTYWWPAPSALARQWSPACCLPPGRERPDDWRLPPGQHLCGSALVTRALL